MKARVRSTGRVVEVKLHPNTKNIMYVDTSTMNMYYEYELDFHDTLDHWDKLLHQYAGMAMQSMLSNTSLVSILFDATKDHEEMLKEVVICSHEYATELVKKLKNE